MGRGRAKAKQQKVARELKYNTPNTDLSALQHELGSVENPHPTSKFEDDSDDDYEDDGRWASAR